MKREEEEKKLVKHLKYLMAEKDSIEEEIQTITDWLFLPGNYGLKQSLVDKEGFPIEDTEKIIATREARGRLACLQNDYKEIMNKIQDGLYSLKRCATENRVSASDVEKRLTQNTANTKGAIAYVDTVSQFSPASEAGLSVGDEVISIGKLSIDNLPAFQAIRNVIVENEDKEIQVEVRRRKADMTTELLTLKLTPKKWKGPGLLGCHILPSSSNIKSD